MHIPSVRAAAIHLGQAIVARLFDPSLAGLRQQLSTITARIITMADTFDTELTALRSDVAAQSTVIASATTAFQGLIAKLTAAETASTNAGATSEQIAAFTTVRQSLEANTAALAAAIPAGTPAAVSTESGAVVTTEAGAPISVDEPVTQPAAPVQAAA